MLNERTATEFLAMKARLAELEEIARAPRDVATVRERIHRLEARERRAEIIAAYVALFPTWPAEQERDALAYAEARRKFEALRSATIARERRAMQINDPGDGNPMVDMAGVAFVIRSETLELNLLEGELGAAYKRKQRTDGRPDAWWHEEERKRGAHYRPGPEPAAGERIVARYEKGRIQR